MDIAVIGLNHETASMELREKVSFSDAAKIEVMTNLLDMGISEVTIISTCNRSEIYIADSKSDIEEKIDLVIACFRRISGDPDVLKHLYIHVGDNGCSHLYRVASGLDSLVLGEDQILGQVKEAQVLAADIGGCKKVLNKLFREAITTAKKIKTELRISEHPISLSYIAAKQLEKIVTDFSDKVVTLIGFGKIGRLTFNYIKELNPKQINLVIRNPKKVTNNISEEISVHDFEHRYRVIKESDIIISATSAPHMIIKEDKAEFKSEVILFDLSMPRDIDGNLRGKEGVTFKNIDDFREESIENITRRKVLSEKALDMINPKVDEFMTWLDSIKVDHIIKSWNQSIREISSDSLDYLDSKLELSHREHKIIERVLNSSLKRLVREPILKLKDANLNGNTDDVLKVIEDLFNIDKD